MPIPLVALRLRPPLNVSNLRKLWDLEWGTFTFGDRVYGKTTAEAADELETLLEGVPLEGRRVLDAGCGLGRAAAELARRRQSRLVASDISHAALLAANAEGLNGFQADLMRLPVRNECCDAAWAHGVLHYLPVPATAVRELARVTRPGGWIAFTIWPPLPTWLRLASRAARTVVSPLPTPCIRALSFILAPLHGLIHRLSRLRSHPVGLSEGAHIIFNMLTAPYLQHADQATVASWCHAAGCDRVRFGTPEIRVLAQKALSAQERPDP